MWIDVFNVFHVFQGYPLDPAQRPAKLSTKENGADGSLFLFGVFDGHGRLGHDATRLKATAVSKSLALRDVASALHGLDLGFEDCSNTHVETLEPWDLWIFKFLVPSF